MSGLVHRLIDSPQSRSISEYAGLAHRLMHRLIFRPPPLPSLFFFSLSLSPSFPLPPPPQQYMITAAVLAVVVALLHVIINVMRMTFMKNVDSSPPVSGPPLPTSADTQKAGHQPPSTYSGVATPIPGQQLLAIIPDTFVAIIDLVRAADAVG